MFLNVNRGKRTIVLDLKHLAARAALLELVRTADVFVHSLRAQATARIWHDYPAVQAGNSRILYANL